MSQRQKQVSALCALIEQNQGITKAEIMEHFGTDDPQEFKRIQDTARHRGILFFVQRTGSRSSRYFTHKYAKENSIPKSVSKTSRRRTHKPQNMSEEKMAAESCAYMRKVDRMMPALGER